MSEDRVWLKVSLYCKPAREKRQSVSLFALRENGLDLICMMARDAYLDASITRLLKDPGLVATTSWPWDYAARILGSCRPRLA